MGRRPRPLRSLRRRLIWPVGLQPAPRQHPAGVPDHARSGLGRLPERGTPEHLLQALATTRPVMQEVGHPGVDLLARDVRPGLPVPAAEVGFQQGVVGDMPPAQAAQVAGHRSATPERRGADQAWQTLPQRVPVDAPRQAPGLARVDAQVGAADAAPRVTGGPRVAPGSESRWARRPGFEARHSGGTT